MIVYDINNLEIVENHEVNATPNTENADTESTDIDNIIQQKQKLTRMMILQ